MVDPLAREWQSIVPGGTLAASSPFDRRVRSLTASVKLFLASSYPMKQPVGKTRPKTLMTPQEPSFHAFMEGARLGAPLTNSVSKAPQSKERIQALILQGFGQGRGEAYRPWIRVTRGNSPRMSNHLIAKLSFSADELHFLSRAEYNAAIVASWLGAREIRTQFPLFPWRAHPHPLSGLDPKLDQQLQPAIGLLQIARNAGIPHGKFVGTSDLPYIATCDLVCRFGPAHNQQLEFWSVKPRSILDDPKLGRRARERIELERLYAEAIGGRHVLVDGELFGRELLSNLDWLEPLRFERTSREEEAHRQKFADHFDKTGQSHSLQERIEQTSTELQWPVSTGQRLFRSAAWLGMIDIDLFEPIQMSRPLRTGGRDRRRIFALKLRGVQ